MGVFTHKDFCYSTFKKKSFLLALGAREEAKKRTRNGAQARPCSIAKRVAAVRELTFSLA